MQACESVEVTVKFATPEPDGVPERSPPEERERPAGREPPVTAKEYGLMPPLAVIFWLYATPCVPFGNEAGETVIVGHVIVIE